MVPRKMRFKPQRLWSEVPEEEWAPNHLWPKEVTCPAAVSASDPYGLDGKWHPCRRKPLPGETFCYIHGGAKAPPRAPTVKVVYRQCRHRIVFTRDDYATLECKACGQEWKMPPSSSPAPPACVAAAGGQSSPRPCGPAFGRR